MGEAFWGHLTNLAVIGNCPNPYAEALPDPFRHAEGCIDCSLRDHDAQYGIFCVVGNSPQQLPVQSVYIKADRCGSALRLGVEG